MVARPKEISGLTSHNCDHKTFGIFRPSFDAQTPTSVHVSSLNSAANMQRPRQRAFLFTSTANFETQQLDSRWEFFYAQVASLKRDIRTVDSDGYFFLITMPRFRIRGRVPGECSHKPLRCNIFTTSAIFLTSQVASVKRNMRTVDSDTYRF